MSGTQKREIKEQATLSTKKIKEPTKELGKRNRYMDWRVK